MADWVTVYEHEIRRRRRVAAEDPVLYKKLWVVNPKGLVAQDDCNEHCWLPATHLMIHDGGPKPFRLGGIIRRAFSEAKPYKDGEVQLVPQICWRCDGHRTKELSSQSTEERLKDLKAQRPRKKKGRTPTGSVESIIDDFFSL